MSAVAEQIDLDALNPMFEKSQPEQIVTWAVATFGDDLVMSSSFGEQAVVLLHMAIQVKPDIRIIGARHGEKTFEHLVAADIVVSSTGSPDPIITKAQFESLRRRRRYRPIFLIDIAVPRDIEPSVGEIDNVYLYNVDDLQQVVASTRTQRQDAIDAAKKIVTRLLLLHQIFRNETFTLIFRQQ